MDSRLEKFMLDNKSKIEFCGAQNSYIKLVKNLSTNAKSNPKREIVIEGIFQHKLALENDIQFTCVFFCPELINSDESFFMLQKLASKTNILLCVSSKVLGIITEIENNFGIASVVQIPKFDLQSIKYQKNSTVIVLDGVEIPGNLGTILRTCDGAGVDAVFLTNKKTRITHPKCVRSSLGAVFCLPVIEFENTSDCIDYLYKNGFKILLADTRGAVDYYNYSYQGRVAIVMGSERYGIVKEWYKGEHTAISIPQLGKCDSLNVANACTILIYESRMKQVGKIKR